MIPREKIEEVVDRSSIVQVVGEYVSLKQRGSNHTGLCPFHSEKTPSFSVSEDKKLFYCFGCHTGGNVIAFVMQKELLSFPEAVRSLASRVGITIEEGTRRSSDRDQLFEGNALAADFFYAELRGDGGSQARAYLKKRGIDKDIAANFKLGFAPDSWSGLLDFLKKNGVSPEAAERTGVVSRKGERLYDRFRGRVVFPIEDIRGRTVAFGARGLGDEEPKYLNSSESPVFKKSDILFGLYRAKGEINKQGFVLVAEGYFDVISLHRFGFTNSVATMGTALTAEHVRRLKGFTPSIYTIFDGDEAGKKAALRGLDIFLDEDAPAWVVLLPAGMDPDDLLGKDGGREEMEKAIKGAVPLMEFFFSELKRSCDLDTPGGKRAFYDKALPYIKRVVNPAEQGHYVELAASLLSIRADIIYSAVSPRREGAGQSRPSESRRAERRVAPIAESTLLRVVVRHPEFYGERAAEAIATFKDPVMKEVGETLGLLLSSGGLLSRQALIDAVATAEARSWLAAILIGNDDGFIEEPSKMLDDSIEKLLGQGALKHSTLEQIKRLEEAGLHDIAGRMKERALRANVRRKG